MANSDEVIARHARDYPSTFSLATKPGRLFRINEQNSFVSRDLVYLYLDILGEDEIWRPYFKVEASEMDYLKITTGGNYENVNPTQNSTSGEGVVNQGLPANPGRS